MPPVHPSTVQEALKPGSLIVRLCCPAAESQYTPVAGLTCHLRMHTLYTNQPHSFLRASFLVLLLNTCLLQNLVTQVIDVEPQPLKPELLARAPELAGDVGLELIKLFKAKGVINASGLLTDDPRRSSWRAIVRESGITGGQQRWLCGRVL